MASPISPPSEPTRGDWFGWIAVAILGGSAPAAINIAIAGAPPAVIAGVRTWLAAGLIIAYCYSTGRRLIPPTTELGRSVWFYGFGAGFFGYAMPFTLFPLAQMEVSSIMAGIVMSFLPVMSVLLAALFAGEPMSKRGFAGVLIGTLGVLVLIGPAVLRGADGTITGVILLLCAVFGYAAMGVVMRRAPEFPARSFAATMMIAAAIMATPFALLEGFDEVTTGGWVSILYLGLGPTGFTAIVIVTVVRRAGAGFLATSAYAAPVISVVLGVLFFSEPLLINQVVGLLIIFSGVALTQNVFVRIQKSIFPRIVTTAFPNKKTRSPDNSHNESPPRPEA